MDVGAISPNGDLYKKVYIHDITKWFFVVKKKGIGIPSDEIRSLNSDIWNFMRAKKVLGFK